MLAPSITLIIGAVRQEVGFGIISLGGLRKSTTQVGLGAVLGTSAPRLLSPPTAGALLRPNGRTRSKRIPVGRARTPVSALIFTLLAGCAQSEQPLSPQTATDSSVSSTTEASARSGVGFDNLQGSRHVPPREWAQIMRDCLAENGWDVVIPADDPAALEHHGVIEQEDAYIEDFVRCSNAHDFSPNPPTMDQDGAERAWQEYTDAAACMREHGYVPPEPPSRELFLTEQLAGGSSWNPHAVPAGEESAAAAAITACPISNDYIIFGIRYSDE